MDYPHTRRKAPASVNPRSMSGRLPTWPTWLVALCCSVVVYSLVAPVSAAETELDATDKSLLAVDADVAELLQSHIHRDDMQDMALQHMSAAERFIFSHSHDKAKSQGNAQDKGQTKAKQTKDSGKGPLAAKVNKPGAAKTAGKPAQSTTKTTPSPAPNAPSSANTVAPPTPAPAAQPTPAVSAPTSTPNPTQPALSSQQTLAEMIDPNARFSGNVRIGRVLQCREVIAGSVLAVNITCRGHLDVQKVMSTEMLLAETAITNTLIAGEIKSKSGFVLVDGDLQISHSQRRGIPPTAPGANPYAVPPTTPTAPTTPLAPTTPPATPAGVQSVSFLAENVVVGGVRQWKLIRHDDFEPDTGGAQGWSLLQTSSCARNGQATSVDHFLGGHCNIANGRVTKTFHHLPPHSQVRVSARYHMIDNWRGETAFMQLGDHYVWSHHSDSVPSPHAVDMCGSELHKETRMSLPIDVVQKHSASFLQVSFGSKGHPDQDACERSFGVDDVMVYVR